MFSCIILIIDYCTIMCYIIGLWDDTVIISIVLKTCIGQLGCLQPLVQYRIRTIPSKMVHNISIYMQQLVTYGVTLQSLTSYWKTSFTLIKQIFKNKQINNTLSISFLLTSCYCTCCSRTRIVCIDHCVYRYMYVLSLTL